MENEKTALFAPKESHHLGEAIASEAGLPLCSLEDRRFSDGEYKIRPLSDTAGRPVVVVQSIYSDTRLSVDEKLCRLLFLISTFKDAGASEVTAVIPYLCYARKDRRTQPFDPVTGRYVAQLLEAAGVDRVITFAVHNLQAFENSFRCPAVHLPAHDLFAAYFQGSFAGQSLTVLSPDIGGIKRARDFQEALQSRTGEPIGIAFMEKKRRDGVISGEETVHGEVAGRTVIIYDDIIASGSTMARAAEAAQAAGARSVIAAASHGLFVEKANKIFASPLFDKIVIADTVLPFRLTSEAARNKVAVLPTGPLFARTLHTSYSQSNNKKTGEAAE